MLTSNNNILLPPLGTNTRENFVDLANTFHQLLPKNSDTIFPAPIAPLPRVKPTKPSYSTAQVIPTVTKKLATPRAKLPRMIQKIVTTVPKIVPNLTTKLPRVAAKHKAIAPPLPEIATQINTSINLRRSARLNHHNSHGQETRTSTSKNKINHTCGHQHSSNAMIEKLNAVINPTTGQMQEYHHLIKGDEAEVWAPANSKK